MGRDIHFDSGRELVHYLLGDAPQENRGGKREGAGRPKRKTKRVLVSFQCSPEERQYLQDICKEVGMTMSGFIKMALKREYQSVICKRDCRKIIESRQKEVGKWYKE